MLYIFTFILLLLISILEASPAAVGLQLPLPSINATLDVAPLPFCVTPQSHPGVALTNSADCANAFRLLIHEPNFAKSSRFSKNPRSGIVLPVGWVSKDCTIIVSCANEHDAAYFRYADVAHRARDIITTCVDGRDEPYGGIAGVSSVQTFYVSVGRQTGIGDTTTLVGGGNATDLANADVAGTER